LCHGLLAFIHLDRRELDRAEASVLEAHHLIERNGLETTFEAMAPSTAAAIVAFRRGDVQRARQLLDAVTERLSLAAAARWYKAIIAIRLGELALDLDDPAAAARLVADAEGSLAWLPDAGTLPARLERLGARLVQQTGDYATLTPAERRVLVQLATHKTLAEIGKTLYVSRTTVKSHVSSIYSKLGVTTRNDAVSHLPHVDRES
jgi:LuxR family maltose regulon positive regulatory protein